MQALSAKVLTLCLNRFPLVWQGLVDIQRDDLLSLSRVQELQRGERLKDSRCPPSFQQFCSTSTVATSLTFLSVRGNAVRSFPMQTAQAEAENRALASEISDTAATVKALEAQLARASKECNTAVNDQAQAFSELLELQHLMKVEKELSAGSRQRLVSLLD